jgi:pimeloyl-ACP methyl ester carboxylesterase
VGRSASYDYPKGVKIYNFNAVNEQNKFSLIDDEDGEGMDNNKTSQQIKLEDERVLGYAEYGSPEGIPIFYFHGFPSSRLDWRLINNDNLLSELNVRVIAPDRPGYGLSDYKRGRKLLDWPEDVIELANKLQIDSFAVLGVSGGNPYAASCAFGIRDRLIKTGMVCGMGPSDAPGMKDGVSWTIPGAPSIIRRVILILTSIGLRRDPDQFISRTKETISEPDSQLLVQPELAASFIEGTREAFRNGISGANQEAALFGRPWGFRLQDITTEVHLWHGEQDLNVPISVGRYVADTIPNCTASFHSKEGHLTLPRNNVEDILSTLVA